MAVVVSRRKKEARTGLHMNFLFFLMSVVVLVVVAISMWKDTHPEWLAYQQKFSILERDVLKAKRADLLQKIEHPNYVQDYLTARQGYVDAKSKFDAVSSTLEATEADLEEMELRLQAGDAEEGASTPPGGGSEHVTAAGTVKAANKGELDELDKEFAGGKSKAPTSSPPAKPAAPTKSDDKELAELDKEFADKGKSKSPAKTPPASKSGGKASSDEMSELDKEFATSEPKKPAGKTSPATSTASRTSSSESDELDKEFGAPGKGKEPSSHGTTASASATPSAAPTFEEADLKVDIPGAQNRLEASQRDLIIAKRTHNRETIGLPPDATEKRQLSDSKLKEANESLAVAQAGVVLETAKSVVKTAAQVARWAEDVKALNALKSSGQLNSQPAARIQQLQDSDGKLQAHIGQLKRDLRLVEGRLSRNGAGTFEVEQIYVERLGAIDRCTTCHKAVEQPGFETTAEPFHTHSADLLRWHPVERFGCVSCHGGWGNALGKSEAHGQEIGKGRPLLVGDQVQASCGKCHGETRQLAGEETYLAGAQLFRQSGCLGCHKIELNQPAASAGPSVLVTDTTPPKAGPDLDRVGEKIKPAWLVGWLQNPQSHSLDARMPNLGLQKIQSEAIATYLMTQHGTAPASSYALPTVSLQHLTAGRRLFENLGCRGCHVLSGEGTAVGPELTNIRGKVDPKWLYGWIQNPKAYFPNSRMPVFNLTPAQSADIGNYLLSVGSDKGSPLDVAPNLSDKRAATLGAQLISERGCAGCHDIKGFERISAPELTRVGDKTADVLEFGNAKGVKHDLYGYILTKVTDPRAFDTDKFKGKMPKFGLAQDDARTIAIYLMSLQSQELPLEYTKDLQEQGSALVAGRRIFAQHDCGACHRVAGEGGKVGPELTREGEMVQPSWLFEFLKRPVRIRWWQDARMPNYHLSDAEATALSEYFMALSNQPSPYEYTPPEQKVFPLALVGAKFFDELKCQSCHPLAGKQGVAGGDSKKLGPDLGLASTRLKKDWMLRFLRDPQAFTPGTQMPTFGKPDADYQSIIDFLMKQHSP